MLTPLLKRIESFGPLQPDEKDAVANVVSRVVNFAAREDIIHEGDRASDCTLILEGYAFRFNHLPDGRRQITALHIPGDFADLQGVLLNSITDGLGTFTPCKVAFVPHTALREITKQHPYLARVLWTITLIDGAIQRQWITALGRLSARERVAHQPCELFVRLKAAGRVEDDSCELPITQEEMGDAFGASGVHINRTLQALRSSALIELRGKRLTVLDWERLSNLAQFSPDYLHLGQRVARD
ncbi:Crp/Fnr family transcriptional regulator [Micromonospora sp. STR1s_5]|nr:Crp/Fnr family transcriptional regulator [Micromonospora sp. STR1s_5]